MKRNFHLMMVIISLLGYILVDCYPILTFPRQPIFNIFNTPKPLKKSTEGRSSVIISTSFMYPFLENFRKMEAGKEESRKLRRTVFNGNDWKKHRSSNRYYREFLNMHKSIVLRSVTIQALGLAAFSALLVVYNIIVELKILPFPKFTFPALPFTLISPSLSLLLVFRTNTAYARWTDGRKYWAVISAKSFDLLRQSAAWVEDKPGVARIARFTVAFSKVLKWHLGTRTNEKRLKEDLVGILTQSEIKQVMTARNKPQFIVTHLTKLIARLNLIPNQQTHMDRSLIDLTLNLEHCDRIFTTPIPLVYTRLTARFLLLWLMTFPLSLYDAFVMKMKWIIPFVSFLTSIFLFGIEDLGVQIEEPFSILPLAYICRNIQDSAQDVLQGSNIQWFEGVEEGEKTTDIDFAPWMSITGAAVPNTSSSSVSSSGSISKSKASIVNDKETAKEKSVANSVEKKVNPDVNSIDTTDVVCKVDFSSILSSSKDHDNNSVSNIHFNSDTNNSTAAFLPGILSSSDMNSFIEQNVWNTANRTSILQ